jgi:DMSO reductase family type II enzyme chaperone
MATTSLPRLSKADRTALDRALARTDAYRFLASAFLDPDAPGTESEIDVAGLASAMEALSLALAPQSREALRSVAGRNARAAEHRRLFGHTVAHGCPPYETEYGRRHVFGQSQELGDVRGFYEAFGVRPRRGGERPDHVACELEFMALLALKEATAIATGERERAEVSRAAARRFLEDHAGRWLPALAGRIAGREPGSGYAALAAAAASLVTAHAGELGARPVALDPDDVVAVTEEPDGLSFECGPDGLTDVVPPGTER